MTPQYKILIQYLNSPGFVIRMALVLERRGYNIQSLQINSGNDNLAIMSLVMNGDPLKLEQVIKQLSKLVDVVSIKDISTARVTTRIISKEQAMVLTQA